MWRGRAPQPSRALKMPSKKRPATSRPPQSPGVQAKAQPTGKAKQVSLIQQYHQDDQDIADAYFERMQKAEAFYTLKMELELQDGTLLDTDIAPLPPSVFKEVVLKKRSRQAVAKMREQAEEVYSHVLQKTAELCPEYTMQQVEVAVQQNFKDPHHITMQTGAYISKAPEFQRKTKSEQADFIRAFLNSEPDFSRVERGEVLQEGVLQALYNTGEEEAIGEDTRLAIGA